MLKNHYIEALGEFTVASSLKFEYKDGKITKPFQIETNSLVEMSVEVALDTKCKGRFITKLSLSNQNKTV